MEKRRNIEATLNKLELQVANNKADILTLKSDVKSYKAKVEEYEANREVIENLGQLMKDKARAEKNIGKATIELATCETNLTTLYKESGSLLQKLEDLNAKKTELANTREEYASYDLFMRCVHTNCVSLDIINNKLPIINSEISSFLANIVDFEIYVQDNDKKLELFIKHPKYEPRSLEMGSGAEKTIAAMAIRLALLSVTSLPKGDVFILDEPGTALDEENMEGFIRILDLIKTHFKTVLLISHLDSMKDTVDSQISIEKRRGAAYVNQ